MRCRISGFGNDFVIMASDLRGRALKIVGILECDPFQDPPARKAEGTYERLLLKKAEH